MDRSFSILLAGLGAALVVSCSSDDSSEGETCVAGQQIRCACAVGEGYQVCKDDGSGYGPCTACGSGTGGGWPGVGGTGGASTGGTGGVGGVGGVGGAATGGVGGSAGAAAGGSAGAPVSHSWIWQDYGGPAYQPAPCNAAVGVTDGKLVDPQAFFSSLIAGKDPNNWVQVLNEIEPQLWACGLGQQRDSGGNVRGRLFLPHANCPDASPPSGDTNAMFLGVRQEPPCWDKFVDVVGNNQ